MSIAELDENLKKATDDFINDTSSELPPESDVSDLARFVYYALDEYRKQIIKYLNEK